MIYVIVSNATLQYNDKLKSLFKSVDFYLLLVHAVFDIRVSVHRQYNFK